MKLTIYILLGFFMFFVKCDKEIKEENANSELKDCKSYCEDKLRKEYGPIVVSSWDYRKHRFKQEQCVQKSIAEEECIP